MCICIYAHLVHHVLDLVGVVHDSGGELVGGGVELLLDDVDLLLNVDGEEDLVDTDVLGRGQAPREAPQVVHRQVALPDHVVHRADRAAVE